MLYDKELIAHKLIRWESFINNYRLPPWHTIPDIGLYMEQVTVLLTQYLHFVPEFDDMKENQVTASSINNYVRLKLMPAPVKKKYYRIHIAYLIMILTLKQSLSIQEVQKAIPQDLEADQVQALYTRYIDHYATIAQFFSRQIRASAKDVLDLQNNSEGAVDNLVLTGALLSGFAKIMTQKLLALQGSTSTQIIPFERVHQTNETESNQKDG